MICGSILTALNNALADKESCYVLNSDTKLHIQKHNHYVYPDVMVLCGKMEFVAARRDIIQNPVLIIEVLSKSTEDYDRGSKFQKYMSLPSFIEYLVISRDKVQVEHYFKKEADHWIFKVYRTLDREVLLGSLGVKLGLQAMYKKIDFD